MQKEAGLLGYVDNKGSSPTTVSTQLILHGTLRAANASLGRIAVVGGGGVTKDLGRSRDRG